MEIQGLTTKEKVIYLRKNGCTIPEICKILSVGKGTVGYHLKGLNINISLLENGLVKTRKNHVNTKLLSENEINDIIVFFQKTKNLKLTHENFPLISKNTIRDMLISKNIFFETYNETPKEKSRRKSLNVINWKKEKKKLLVEYKGGKCEKCGYNKCIEALEFHHIDPSKKDFNISTHSFSFDKMKIEADKCLLLCSNCHKEIHVELRKKDKKRS